MLEYLGKRLAKKVDDFVLLKTEEDVSHLKFAENKIVKTGTESLEATQWFLLE